eukprot:TRINITY_DN30640_c0_g1_i1.p1 TRINITY_DN30640_c0_g1~~TRINITY_DN30640_c0_g1_i1.p1  ORF type:complete len:176 (+),score=55.36 TRINITY_DN30640_c0_g1_i1:52-579(+)
MMMMPSPSTPPMLNLGAGALHQDPHALLQELARFSLGVPTNPPQMNPRATMMARHQAEQVRLLREQAAELAAVETQLPNVRVGSVVKLLVGTDVTTGVVVMGPHADGSVNIVTEQGELHLYCEMHRVQVVDRSTPPETELVASQARRAPSESESFGLTDSPNCSLHTAPSSMSLL